MGPDFRIGLLDEPIKIYGEEPRRVMQGKGVPEGLGIGIAAEGGEQCSA